MAVFVLIHGAWHGAWCWTRLSPLLAQAGHRVITPDLPGCGADHTVFDTLGFDDWTDSVVACLRAAGCPAVLVGHSRGGAVISSVAERAPELVDRLVYLAAFLLCDGQSVLDIAAIDAESIVAKYMVPDAIPGDLTVRERGAGVSWRLPGARRRLRPRPVASGTAVRLGDPGACDQGPVRQRAALLYRVHPRPRHQPGLPAPHAGQPAMLGDRYTVNRS